MTYAENPDTASKPQFDRAAAHAGRRMIDLPPPLKLKRPSVMSAAELAGWAQIGKNSIPMFVAKFGIRELTGNAKNHRFSVLDIFKRVLGSTPQSPEELESLLLPLQKVTWVSQMTGLSVSAISAGACEKRGALPFPIELTVTGQDQAPARGRRWIPAQIEAHLYGDPIPFLAPQTTTAETPPKDVAESACNVFAAICGSNAEVPRQLQL